MGTDEAAPGAPAVPVRPAHRDPLLLALVLAGGMAGTLARWAVGRAIPARDGWPMGTLVANLLGAFLLGWLLEALARAGADEGRRRQARLLLGTGFLGAFTTMSSLALESFLLLDAHRSGVALGYLAASLAGGALAAWLGILLGGRRATR